VKGSKPRARGCVQESFSGSEPGSQPQGTRGELSQGEHSAAQPARSAAGEEETVETGSQWQCCCPHADAKHQNEGTPCNPPPLTPKKIKPHPHPTQVRAKGGERQMLLVAATSPPSPLPGCPEETRSAWRPPLPPIGVLSRRQSDPVVSQYRHENKQTKRRSEE